MHYIMHPSLFYHKCTSLVLELLFFFFFLFFFVVLSLLCLNKQLAWTLMRAQWRH